MEIKERQANMLVSVVRLFQGLTRMSGEIFDLAALEITLAKKSFAQMLGYGVVLTILLATAWVSLMGAIFYGLSGFGLNQILSLLLIACFNFAVAACIGMIIIKLRKNLTLPTTRQQLTFRGSTQ